MDNIEIYRLYLRDFVYLLKESYSELKQEVVKDDFKNEIGFGYYAIINLIENQVESFKLELRILTLTT